MDLNKLQEEIKQTSEKLLKYDHKVSQIEHYAAERRDRVDQLQKKLDERRAEIMRMVKFRVGQLKYVFPIVKVVPKV